MRSRGTERRPVTARGHAEACAARGRRRSRVAAWACAGILAWLAPREARADDIDEFLIARDNFAAGEFAQAAVQLRRLVGVERPLSPPQLVEPARKYYAAALFSMGQRQQAEQVIEAILRDNPDARFSAVLFSPPLLALFDQVFSRMLPILNALRLARIEADAARQRDRAARRSAQQSLLRELATREIVVVRSPQWTAPLPLGVGQFVNGQTGAGAAFLASELTLAAGAVSLVYACEALVPPSAATEPGLTRMRGCAGAQVNTPAASTIQAFQVANVVTWSLFGATLVGGMVHGIITHRVERREVRARPAPPGFDRIELAGLRVVPAVDGASATLLGRF